MDDRTSFGAIQCWTINSFVLPESKTMMSPRCLSLRHQLLETRSRSFPSNFQNGFARFARFARFTWFWRLTASPSTLPRVQNHEGKETLTPPLHWNVRYIVVFIRGWKCAHRSIQFFRNDPIYGTFSKFIDTKVVVELLGSGVDSQKAVKIVPSRPRGIVRVHVRFQLSIWLSGELELSTLKPRWRSKDSSAEDTWKLLPHVLLGWFLIRLQAGK